MNSFGLNRAALNATIVKAIAGAAVIAAAGSLAATGLRTVNVDPLQVVTSGSLAATGVRVVMPVASVISATSMQAVPGLLFLTTANIVAGGALQATNTEAYFSSAGVFQAAGTDIQNASANFVASTAASSATPLYTAGTASNFVSFGTMTADASTKPNGSSFTNRDGYPTLVPVGGTMTANCLRTAYAGMLVNSVTSTYCVGNVTMAGAANVVAFTVMTALGSADGSRFYGTGTFTAGGFVTQNADPLSLAGVTTFTATQNVLTQGVPCQFNAIGSLSATANLGTQAASSMQGTGTLSPTAVVYQMAGTQLACLGTMTAFAGLLQQGSATFLSVSAIYPDALINAQSLDPPERTMMRPFNDRVMLRLFVDRTMKREP